MKNQQRMGERQEGLDRLMELVWRDPTLWCNICDMEWYDKERLDLLYQILQAMAQKKRNDDVENWIYQYGSMIKEQDMIPRHIFIWLLQLVEEIPCVKKE